MAKNKAINGPVPDSPHVVTASPTVGGAPQEDWDATSTAVISRWAPVEPGSGPADMSGNATSTFENGPGRWKQT